MNTYQEYLSVCRQVGMLPAVAESFSDEASIQRQIAIIMSRYPHKPTPVPEPEPDPEPIAAAEPEPEPTMEEVIATVPQQVAEIRANAQKKIKEEKDKTLPRERNLTPTLRAKLRRMAAKGTIAPHSSGGRWLLTEADWELLTKS